MTKEHAFMEWYAKQPKRGIGAVSRGPAHAAWMGACEYMAEFDVRKITVLGYLAWVPGYEGSPDLLLGQLVD